MYHCRGFWLIVAVVVSAGLVSSTHADVTGVSVSQTANVQGNSNPPPPGVPSSISDSKSNNAFPPVALTAHASAAIADATASISINSYTGPATAGGSTPGLTLVGESVAGFTSNTTFIDGGATSNFSYVFSLDATQSYSWNSSFTSNAFSIAVLNLKGPGNITIPTGSGMLSPGTYTLTAELEQFTNFSDDFSITGDFNLVVSPLPEPDAIAGLAVAFAASTFRRPKRTAVNAVG